MPTFAMGGVCIARPPIHTQTWYLMEGVSHFSAYLEISAALSALWPEWDAPLLRAGHPRSVPASRLFLWFISLRADMLFDVASYQTAVIIYFLIVFL